MSWAERSILVSGCARFIGSNFVHSWLSRFDDKIVNVDKFTSAGNLADLEAIRSGPRQILFHGDIEDRSLAENLLADRRSCAVPTFAAELQLERSIYGPSDFIRTNKDISAPRL